MTMAQPCISGTIPGERGLDRPAAYSLARASGADLAALFAAAARCRDRQYGSAVSYSRKVFVDLSHLCRNRCAYCSFRRRPSPSDKPMLDPEDVVAIARAGAAQGCKEALFCLGERPEERYPHVSQALTRLGHRHMVDYLVAMCDLVARETGLLPHCNCGVLDAGEWSAVASVVVSAGLMLESSSARLCGPGGPHYRCPGKHPATRLASITAAGRQGIAFTTGILIGIGETPEERVDALLAIQDIHSQFGHIQEVIVQNFQPQPRTPMANLAAPSEDDRLRTVALARLILSPEVSVQAPPNLAPGVYQRYLVAGINDWGGISPVTADLINPDAAWPQIEELRGMTRAAGFELRERLAVYPSFLRQSRFVPANLRPLLRRHVDPTGFATTEHG